MAQDTLGSTKIGGQEHLGKLTPPLSILVTKEAAERLGILMRSPIFIWMYRKHKQQRSRKAGHSASTWLEQRQARVLTRVTGTL